jgi:transcriptional regulator with XRE-family HTH domain
MTENTRGEPTALRHRIRAFRMWREMTQQQLADLAGISRSYLTRIESGTELLNSRATLEKIAKALEMSSPELTGGALGKPGMASEHQAIGALRLVLTDVEIGETVERRVTLPWPQVQERVDLANQRRHRADYAGQGDKLPDLIYDLHAHLTGPNRRDALVGLVYSYYAAGVTCKNLGASDLMLVAAGHIRRLTELLAAPEWSAMGAWMLTLAIGGTARDRAYRVAARAAEDLSDDMDRPETVEMYGSLHLAASLAATNLGRTDDAQAHVAEAIATAKRPGIGIGFGELWFGQPNIDIWRAVLDVEAGRGPRAVELARTVDPETLPPAPIRRADWWITVGRGLAATPRNRLKAVELFQRAERLAPQRVRTNPFVGEITDDVMLRLRVNAIPKDVRAFAVRLGRSPSL